ncbi:GNAT family N-acetyltransferase [Chitinophaga solisilvae]|uniref:GNAT family N-acetyltransferase n=1 Tax=Chitinophaga solisilvae TaxID=1233460 RepID=UPI001369D74A|nr:GNAT family protein [Chitinophaga solisilvae]
MESARLVLRKLTTGDIPDVHRLHSIPETDEFNTLGLPATIAVTEQLVEEWMRASDTQVWCITEKDTRTFVGLIGLILKPARFRSGEIWYKLDIAHWGRGITTEAVQLLLAHAFDTLSLHRVEAGCAVDNIGSVKVLEKCGMAREGSKRKVLPVRGTWLDNYMYAILEEDYRAK